MSADWDNLRGDFPCLDETVYLNAAGVGPLPSAVYQAGVKVLDGMHRKAKTFAEDMFVTNITAHQSIADFYNVDINDVAFVHTTSLGMSMLALLFGRRSEGKKHIVTLANEFPASTLPWAAQGFDLSYVEADENHCAHVEDILAALQPYTQAVVASYVQFGSGHMLDIQALAKELRVRGVHLVLNATQAAGVIPIDLKEMSVSAMLVSGNKWMMAGYGAATLCISEELRDDSFPPLAGWLTAEPFSYTRNRLDKLSRNAHGLELGLNSLVPIACLNAAVHYIQALGVENIRSRVGKLTDTLIAGLIARGAKVLTPTSSTERAGIVTVIRDDAHSWVERLKSKNIIVVLRGEDAVRISPHFYNNESDLMLLLENW